jgi:type VII secretion protein EccB
VPPETTVDPGIRTAPAAAPATRDQVDAYRFGLRRLEAALVRGDPVLLHEQIRAQRRAVATGAVLGVLGLVAAAVAAVVAPEPDWRSQDLVVGSPSGALYAVARDPDRLVPVANAVAGRLVLAALRTATPEPSAPVLVDDALLATAPRTPAAAVPGAVAADPGQRIAPRWAVCDEVDEVDEATATAARPRLAGTTVVAGSAPAPSGDPGTGVLLAVPGGDTWLVVSGRRHAVDVGNTAIRTALGIGDRVPRPASSGLVSALPEGPRLLAPLVPDAGTAGPAGVPGRVGDVLSSRPSGGPQRYYVVLADGLQEVPPLVADVLAAASGAAVEEIGPEVVAGVATVHRLDLAGWPQVAPRLLESAEAPVTCWTWSGEAGADPAGGVHVGRMWSAGRPVVLAGADGAGEALDAVVVGAGGTARATAPGVPAGVGTMWVVSAGGVAHGVADPTSAAALGIAAVEPAPEAALRLLPTGATLDVAAADRAVDVTG